MIDISVRDVLFWIFLVISLVLLVWNVFGNSPTEFLALTAMMFTVMLKVWSVSDRQIKADMRFTALAKCTEFSVRLPRKFRHSKGTAPSEAGIPPIYDGWWAVPF